MRMNRREECEVQREKQRDDDAEQKGRVVVAQKGKGKAES